MRHLLWLIEGEPPVSLDGTLGLVSRQLGFQCQRQLWDSSSASNIFQRSLDLVLFSGGPARERDGFVQWLRCHPLRAPVLAVLPQDCDEDTLRPVAQIVDDFVVSPVHAEELQCRLERILGPRTDDASLARQPLKEELGLAQLVGEDPHFVRAIQRIPAIAASAAPALLLGETGTGKELCAQAIHALSRRHAGTFIPVECGAIPEHLVENELFGHARGAFTDAHCDQKGLAAMADGGTLFLDEIDSLPLAAQAKLLRFIQEGTYRPLGSQKFIRADVRLIAAANRDLEKCVRDGQFRSDLFFRLNVLPLRLPSLRDRRGDIATLTRHFLKTLQPSADPRKLSPAAMRALQGYDWPGNVRELHNVIQRSLTFSEDSAILPVHLGLPDAPRAEHDTRSFRKGRSQAIEEFERHYLEAMLRQCGGNVTRAAMAAGKDRRVFGRLMKRYGIDRRSYE